MDQLEDRMKRATSATDTCRPASQNLKRQHLRENCLFGQKDAAGGENQLSAGRLMALNYVRQVGWKFGQWGERGVWVSISTAHLYDDVKNRTRYARGRRNTQGTLIHTYKYSIDMFLGYVSG